MNGWTGGQYSVFRVLFGLFLVVHFASLIRWGTELFSERGVLPRGSVSPLLHLFPNVLAVADGPPVVAALLVFGTIAGLLFAAGLYDRTAAVVAWYVLTCVFGRNPLIANPALPFVGWMLLAHAFLPPAPYGSLAARGRADPGAGWRMPQPLFLAAWIVMATGYSYSGCCKLVSPSWVDGSAVARVLDNPLARPGHLREMLLSVPPALLKIATWCGLGLELLYAPLALFRRVRPWIWWLMVGMHLGLLATIDFAELTLGMLLVHAFTFDPAWLSPSPAAGKDTVFYDGHCGLCHRFVRFAVAEDGTGDCFEFAPLQGAYVRTRLTLPERAGLPDSVVVRTAQGELLVRSAAMRRVLRRLGGVWRGVAAVARLLPSAFLDWFYDGVARLRRWMFDRPDEICPLLPPQLRERFHS